MMAYDWRNPSGSTYGTQNTFGAPTQSGWGAYPTGGTVPPPTTVKPRNPYTAGASTSTQSFMSTPLPGGWGWNEGNPVNVYQQAMPPTGLSAFQPATPTGTYLQAPGPAMGSSFEPPPSNNMDVATPLPGFANRTVNTVTGDAFMGGAPVGNVNPPNVDVLTPQPVFNAPTPQPGFNVPGMETQYATLPNIEAYMTPYLDQIIGRGNKNILANASARGLLGSTGTGDELGDWAARAQADAFNDAFGRFAADRGYMTDMYRDGRNFDYRNFRDTDAWNYGLYSDEKSDWYKRMGDWYNANSGIVNTGVNASNRAGDIQTFLGANIAELFKDRGGVGSQQATNQGGMNNWLVDAIISAITGKTG